jgi:hypothetical protein
VVGQLIGTLSQVQPPMEYRRPICLKSLGGYIPTDFDIARLTLLRIASARIQYLNDERTKFLSTIMR